MLKDLLKSIIQSQQEWLVPEEKEIPREQLNKFFSPVAILISKFFPFHTVNF
ncbi:MAG: hypothetical protein M1292_09620 [Bacteroidetes bacterium]|nr:hypothetical protein [Bacteroidota bacterium]